MITAANWLWVTLTFLCLHVIFLDQWKYREQYERAKDKFTSILETPEYESHRRSKKIGDVSFWFSFYVQRDYNFQKIYLCFGVFWIAPDYVMMIIP